MSIKDKRKDFLKNIDDSKNVFGITTSREIIDGEKNILVLSKMDRIGLRRKEIYPLTKIGETFDGVIITIMNDNDETLNKFGFKIGDIVYVDCLARKYKYFLNSREFEALYNDFLKDIKRQEYYDTEK